MISYTSCQESALHMLDSFVLSNETVMVLEGFAGTGKTTVITTYEKKIRRDVVYLAPTHKAVRILKEMAKKNNIHVTSKKFMTIHSFFCMQVEYDKNGKPTFKSNEQRLNYNLSKYKNPLLIIDEISMISKELYDVIITIAKKNKLKMVCLGDRSQLPPIEKLKCTDNEDDGEEKEYETCIETLSPFFKDEFKYHTKMNEVKRTSNSDIKELYEIFRHYSLDEDTKKFKQKLSGFKNKNKNSNIKIVTSKNHFTKHINNQIAKENSYVLCARNKTVNDYVISIKKKLFPNSEKPFNEGEKIYFTKYFKFDNSKNCNCYWGKPEWCKANHFYTSEEYIITSVCNKTKSFYGKEYNVYEFELDYQLHDGEFLKVYKIIESELDDFKKHVKHEKAELKKLIPNMSKKMISDAWMRFNTEVSSMNAPFVSAYAITAYKAQGSTYNHIFIDAQDIEECRRSTFLKPKELYTSVTRGSKSICIYIELEKEYMEQKGNTDKLKCIRCRCWKDKNKYRTNKKGTVVKTCLDCSEKARLKRLN